MAAVGYCQGCGTPVPERPEHLEYCEGCYLDELRQRRISGLEDAYLKFAKALIAALDLREHETGQHSKRVACHTLLLASHSIEEEGRLKQVCWGALLHDLGKIGVPDRVLLKEGELDTDEWSIMREHPQMAYDIIMTVPFLEEASDIALCHEERFDGTGYPRGLHGEEIPWPARLFSIIDTVDAITSDRPYRAKRDFSYARDEVLAQSGSQFDPEAVAVFIREEAALEKMITQKFFRTPEYLETHRFSQG